MKKLGICPAKPMTPSQKAEPVSGSLTTALVAKRILENEPGATIVYNVICSRVVREVIAAMLGNVFAHTPDGAGVRVVMDRDGDEVLIVVEDDGPGFPPGALARGASGGGSTTLRT